MQNSALPLRLLVRLQSDNGLFRVIPGGRSVSGKIGDTPLEDSSRTTSNPGSGLCRVKSVVDEETK